MRLQGFQTLKMVNLQKWDAPFSSQPPPGETHHSCTQFGGVRNGGLIVDFWA